MRIVVILIGAVMCTACANMYGGVGVSTLAPQHQAPVQ